MIKQNFVLFCVLMFGFATVTSFMQAKIAIEACVVFTSGENSKKIVQKQVILDTEKAEYYKINLLSDVFDIINYIVCPQESTVGVAVVIYRNIKGDKYDLIASQENEVEWGKPAVFELENGLGESLLITISVTNQE